MEYQLFSLCPFTIASIGGGGSFAGIGSESYTWTHSPCLEKNCRLWTYKVDEKGEVYAEGCSLQFIGLNKDEIKTNLETKKKITMAAYEKELGVNWDEINKKLEMKKQLSGGADDFCETCINFKKVFFQAIYSCKLNDKEVDKKDWCEKYKRRLNNL